MAAPSKKFKINDKSTEIVMPNKLKGSKSKLIIKAKRSRPTGFKEWNERETELFIDLMSGNDLNINVKRKVLRGQSKNIGLLNEVSWNEIVTEMCKIRSLLNEKNLKKYWNRLADLQVDR